MYNYYIVIIKFEKVKINTCYIFEIEDKLDEGNGKFMRHIFYASFRLKRMSHITNINYKNIYNQICKVYIWLIRRKL